MGCDKTITLLRLDQDENYLLWRLEGVHVYRQVKSSMQERGMVYASEAKVRVPVKAMPEGLVPQVGDTLVFSSVETAPGRPADLKGLPTATVVHVGDNRCGGLPHWLLVGK